MAAVGGAVVGGGGAGRGRSVDRPEGPSREPAIHTESETAVKTICMVKRPQAAVDTANTSQQVWTGVQF